MAWSTAAWASLVPVVAGFAGATIERVIVVSIEGADHDLAEHVGRSVARASISVCSSPPAPRASGQRAFGLLQGRAR